MNIQDLLDTRNEHIETHTDTLTTTTHDAAEELEILVLGTEDEKDDGVVPKTEDTEMIGAAEDLEAELVDIVDVDVDVVSELERELEVEVEVEAMADGNPVASTSQATASRPKAKPKAKRTRVTKAPAKKKPNTSTSTAQALLKAESSANASRATSVIPATAPADIPKSLAIEDETLDILGGEDEEDDGRVYCICQSNYDEASAMIACDRCEDWFHPHCVSLSDAELELIDLFVCPRCSAAHPELQTTYKSSCARQECTHPSRIGLSKYCSDACGIAAVMARVDAWGGNTARLLEVPPVKRARRLEGLVVPAAPSNLDDDSIMADPNATETRETKELAHLQSRLLAITNKREVEVRGAEGIQSRLKLLHIATRHSENAVELCGFDSRLVMDEVEWNVWMEGEGREVLQCGEVNEEEGWWCTGKRKCERHAGWQKLKSADFELDKAIRDKSLEVLANRERDLRRRIEDLEAFVQAQAWKGDTLKRGSDSATLNLEETVER